MGFHIEPSTCGLEYNYPNIYPYSHDTLSNKTNNPQTQPSMSTVESSLSLSLFCFVSRPLSWCFQAHPLFSWTLLLVKLMHPSQRDMTIFTTAGAVRSISPARYILMYTQFPEFSPCPSIWRLFLGTYILTHGLFPDKRLSSQSKITKS